MNEADHQVVQAMEKYGGSFVVALAKAARQADHNNLAKIKVAFSNYWEEYTEMARLENKPNA